MYSVFAVRDPVSWGKRTRGVTDGELPLKRAINISCVSHLFLCVSCESHVLAVFCCMGLMSPLQKGVSS